MEVILTHNNADFDAVASMLGAHKLYPSAVPVLSRQLNHGVEEFVTLYQNGLPFIRWGDLRPDAIERVILVDTQHIPDIPKFQPDTPVLIIDHHPQKRDLGDNVTFKGDEVGAATTLLVEKIREEHITITSLEATLLMLGIHQDTGSLTYGTTTPRDMEAAAWLLKHNAVLDTVRRFLSPPLDDAQQTLFDKLVKSTQSRNVKGYAIVVAAVRMDEYVDEISSVAHRLRDVLDPEALFVVVAMPETVQMVCRSKNDAIDVGKIARRFGGGGHSRAAAAKIDVTTLEEVVDTLWDELEQNIRPVTRVVDLMSYGVQTVHPDDVVAEIIQQLRRIGHEGFPVVENGHVVGLLTRRDADRALEHGLREATVREVMDGGEVTLRPDDSVTALEQLMVDSGWGQIPVVDDEDKLIGIVTRTDLIKHWTYVHPAAPIAEERIEADQIASVLGSSIARLIEAVAGHADQRQLSMYMVGGVVRDLLLHRPNLDLDFVIEGDAIRFAQDLAAIYGGEINSFRPFGTAKWTLAEQVARNLRIDFDELPEHVDFATSRNEFYKHPTALPSVYSSSIKLDLQRRDFTINTLATQLSPRQSAGRLLDFYGGLNDLRNGIVRVLHSLSFVDDPTRVLRAVRFEQRLGFEIEPRTAELINTARPMLRRITGERVRNELDLLLHEEAPERGLRAMQERGILPAIHPAFHFRQEVAEVFESARALRDEWPVEVEDIADLYWHLALAHISLEGIQEVSDRLLFAHTAMESFIATAQLIRHPDVLAEPDQPVSRIVRRLDGVPETALLAAWILSEGLVRERIERFLNEWQHIEPVCDGYTLQEMGLPPGPCYRPILEGLRNAVLDGGVSGEVEERQLLDRLVEEFGDDCA